MLKAHRINHTSSAVRLFARAATLLAAAASVLLVSAPASAQALPTPTPSVDVAPSTACLACFVDVADDPLTAYSLRLMDAWTQWDAAPASAWLCVSGDELGVSYQFSIQPALASAPLGATCAAKDPSAPAPAPLPLPTVVLPPVVVLPPAPPAPGPVVPSPAQDIIIEQRPAVTVAPVQPAAPLPVPVRPPAPNTSSSHSTRSTRPTPTPATVVGNVQSRPSQAISRGGGQASDFAPAADAGISSRSATQSQSTDASGSSMPAAQSSDASNSSAPAAQSTDANGSATPAGASTDASSSSAPAAPSGDASLSSMSVVLLGYVPTLDGGDPAITDFVNQPDTLLVGSLLLQFQNADGTTMPLDGSGVSFTLWPADAALLALDGDPAQLTVRAFDASLGGLRQRPAGVVVNPDGGVSINVGAGFSPAAADVAPTTPTPTDDPSLAAPATTDDTSATDAPAEDN